MYYLNIGLIIALQTFWFYTYYSYYIAIEFAYYAVFKGRNMKNEVVSR